MLIPSRPLTRYLLDKVVRIGFHGLIQAHARFQVRGRQTPHFLTRA